MNVKLIKNNVLVMIHVVLEVKESYANNAIIWKGMWILILTINVFNVDPNFQYMYKCLQ